MLVFSRKYGRRAKAIRTILGDAAEIARATDLHRTRRGRTLLVELAGGTDRVVLKRCRQPAGSLREVRNLIAVNGVAGVNAPRFLGEWQNYFVEEFIAAEPVPRVLEGSDDGRAARCRDAVVRHLAVIHAANWRNKITSGPRGGRVSTPPASTDSGERTGWREACPGVRQFFRRERHSFRPEPESGKFPDGSPERAPIKLIPR